MLKERQDTKSSNCCDHTTWWGADKRANAELHQWCETTAVLQRLPHLLRQEALPYPQPTPLLASQAVESRSRLRTTITASTPLQSRIKSLTRTHALDLAHASIKVTLTLAASSLLQIHAPAIDDDSLRLANLLAGDKPASQISQSQSADETCNCEVRLRELRASVPGSGFLRRWSVYELIDSDKPVRNVTWLAMHRVSHIL